MNMKDHILAALKEQFDLWEQLLDSLSEDDLVKPSFDDDWAIKDVIAHLWAWQQISIARLEAGLQNRDPDYPAWIVKSIANWEEDADRVNALTFEIHHKQAWSEIYRAWRDGFLHFLELGANFSERDLLDGDRYPWLQGYSLASILIASYDHHQEHLEKLRDWQKAQ